MDHLAKAVDLASSFDNDRTWYAADVHANISIAQSLADLAKLAMRLEPLLVRLEEELTKDGIHELKDHAA